MPDLSIRLLGVVGIQLASIEQATTGSAAVVVLAETANPHVDTSFKSNVSGVERTASMLFFRLLINIGQLFDRCKNELDLLHIAEMDVRRWVVLTECLLTLT